MHQLSIEIKYEPYPGSASSRRELSLECSIDGILLIPWNTFAMDVFALVESAKKPGTYFIWTCDCGIPECAGIYQGVQVIHRPDTVVWKDNKHPLKHFPYAEFDKGEYTQTIQTTWDQYLGLAEGYMRGKEDFVLSLYGQDIEGFLVKAGRLKPRR